MIRIKHVTKSFGKLTAVDDVSLEVQDGEVFGLLFSAVAARILRVD